MAATIQPLAVAAALPGLTQALGLMQNFRMPIVLLLAGLWGCSEQPTRADAPQFMTVTCWSKQAIATLDHPEQCAPKEIVATAMTACSSTRADEPALSTCMREQGYVRVSGNVRIFAPQTKRTPRCTDTRPVEDCPGQLD